MSQLPSDFEKIVIIAQQFYESEHKTANAAIRYAVERCYALANKPVTLRDWRMQGLNMPAHT